MAAYRHLEHSSTDSRKDDGEEENIVRENPRKRLVDFCENRGRASTIRAKTNAASTKSVHGKETPSRIRFRFDDGAYATVRLLWKEAPQTCAAVVKTLKKHAKEKSSVNAVHGRNSGAEALFLTPEVVRLGDENVVKPGEYAKGQFLFGYEPRFICEHAKQDASEIAWIYHEAAQPRRWVSIGGDKTNQSFGPWKTVDVSLNLFGTVENECGFYEASSRLPRTGERGLSIDFL